jgi:hypothetical protein
MGSPRSDKLIAASVQWAEACGRLIRLSFSGSDSVHRRPSQMKSHSHLAHVRPSAPLPASINFTPQLLISIAAT